MFDQLNDDVLRIIFSKLGILQRLSVERVCRRFSKLAQNCWHDVISVRFSSMFENDEEFFDVRDCNKIFVPLLKRAGPYIRHLNLSISDNCAINLEFSARSLRNISRYCPQLYELDLSFCSLTNHHLNSLFEVINSLRILRLVRCFEDECNADNGLAILFPNASNLQLLDLSMNDTLIGGCFAVVPESLLEIYINTCANVTLDNLHLLAQRCQRLTLVDLSNYAFEIGGDVLSLMGPISVLKLNYCKGSVDDLQTALASLPQLQRLELQHSSLINDNVLRVLGEHCTSLLSLNISGKYGQVTDQGLRFLSCCTDLAELDISWIETVGSVGLTAVAKCGKLRALNAHNCDGLSWQAIVDCVKLCPLLTSLNLTGCRQLTQEFYKEIFALADLREQQLALTVSISSNVKLFRKQSSKLLQLKVIS